MGGHLVHVSNDCDVLEARLVVEVSTRLLQIRQCVIQVGEFHADVDHVLVAQV